jgi:hypothetical protein
MKNKKLLKTLTIAVSTFILTALCLGVVSFVSDKSPNEIILGIFRRNVETNLATDEFRDTTPFASVNGIPIPRNIIAISREVSRALEEYLESNNDAEGDGSFTGLVPLSDEQIVMDIARRLLFIEYAKSEGIVVEENEIAEHFSRIRADRERLLQENDPDAVLAEQMDMEFFEIIGLSRDEYNEYFLKEQVVYFLYSIEYGRIKSDGYSDEELLASADIVYYD